MFMSLFANRCKYFCCASAACTVGGTSFAAIFPAFSPCYFGIPTQSFDREAFGVDFPFGLCLAVSKKRCGSRVSVGFGWE